MSVEDSVFSKSEVLQNGLDLGKKKLISLKFLQK